MQGLTRLEIENVQSIGHLVLDLAPNGVFWIKGKSNIGKSAILKALKALFTNISSVRYKELIRDGEDTFRVTGHFGLDVVTLSRGASDFYEWTINGEYGRVDRTQGKVPSELKEFFNLYWTGDKVNRYINFTLVGESLFFSETSSVDNSLILEKAIGVDRLSFASKAASERKKEITRELKPYQSLIEEEERRVTSLSDELAVQKAKLDKVERLEDALKRESEWLERLERILLLTCKKEEFIDELNRLEVKTSLSFNEVDEWVDLMKRFDKVYVLESDRERLLKELEGVRLLGQNDLQELELLADEYERLYRLEDVEKQKNLMEVQLSGLSVALDALKQQEAELLSQYEVCPVCNRPMKEGESC